MWIQRVKLKNKTWHGWYAYTEEAGNNTRWTKLLNGKWVYYKTNTYVRPAKSWEVLFNKWFGWTPKW